MLTALRRWLGPGLVAAVIVAAPLNIFLKAGESAAYVHGLLSDYLLIKWYLSDFFIWALIIWGSWYIWQETKQTPKLQFVRWLSVVTVIPICLMALHPTTWHIASSWWTALRLWQMCWLCLVLLNPKVKAWWDEPVVNMTLVLNLLIQSGLTYYQWFAQRSLLPYYWLGESNLRQGYSLATTIWQGSERVLPYGTTPHPNVLAGILVGYWVWWQLHPAPKGNALTIAVTTLVGGALWLTQSASAWWAASLVLLLFCLRSATIKTLAQKVGLQVAHSLLIAHLCLALLIPSLLPILTRSWPNETSLTRRQSLATVGWQLWSDHPILGLGLNQFIPESQELLRNQEVVRFNQPIHHVGLLWAVETGWVGVGLAMAGFGLLIRRWRHLSPPQQWQQFLALGWLVPLMMWDHYLITLSVGGWLIIGSLITAIDTKS